MFYTIWHNFGTKLDLCRIGIGKFMAKFGIRITFICNAYLELISYTIHVGGKKSKCVTFHSTIGSQS